MNSKKLAKYIVKQMEGCTVKGLDTEMLFVEKPLESTLEFWIGQYKRRKCVGHHEWSEKLQRNIWVSDYEEE
jgi:hypothetical protein